MRAEFPSHVRLKCLIGFGIASSTSALSQRLYSGKAFEINIDRNAGKSRPEKRKAEKRKAREKLGKSLDRHCWPFLFC